MRVTAEAWKSEVHATALTPVLPATRSIALPETTEKALLPHCTPLPPLKHIGSPGAKGGRFTQMKELPAEVTVSAPVRGITTDAPEASEKEGAGNAV